MGGKRVMDNSYRESEWISVASVKLSFVASQFNHSRVVWVEAYFVDEMG